MKTNMTPIPILQPNVVHGPSDHLRPTDPDKLSGESLACESETVCEIGEYQQKLQHNGAGGQQNVSETGGDGCECQIDYYQADRADEKVTVDGEESPDLVAIESGLEVQSRDASYYIPEFQSDTS